MIQSLRPVTKTPNARLIPGFICAGKCTRTRKREDDLFVVNAKIFRGRAYALTNPRPVQLAEVPARAFVRHSWSKPV